MLVHVEAFKRRLGFGIKNVFHLKTIALLKALENKLSWNFNTIDDSSIKYWMGDDWCQMTASLSY